MKSKDLIKQKNVCKLKKKWSKQKKNDVNERKKKVMVIHYW